MMTEVRAHLVPPAEKALRDLCEATGLSEADIVNRALQVYGVVQPVQAVGGELLIRWTDGDVSVVKIEEVSAPE